MLTFTTYWKYIKYYKYRMHERSKTYSVYVKYEPLSYWYISYNIISFPIQPAEHWQIFQHDSSNSDIVLSRRSLSDSSNSDIVLSRRSLSDIQFIAVTSTRALTLGSASHDNWCTGTLLNSIITAQRQGMGDVGSARYDPALLPPCLTIRVSSYSNCQRCIHSISK